MDIDSMMPLWRRTEAVEAMRIDEIAVPTLREPFMWNLVGHVGRGKTHTEQVHAHWIAQHRPEVGGYLVRELDGKLAYLPAQRFEQWHVRMDPDPIGIEPLAGQEWRQHLPVGIVVKECAAPMEGVDIDKAHGQAKSYDWQG